MTKGGRTGGEGAAGAVRAAQRLCPNCGAALPDRHGPGQHQKFCNDDCAKKFRGRCAARGKIIIPLALAWRGGRGKRNTISAQAHAELISVLDAFAAEDRAEKRPKLDDYVGGMLASGFRYVDRKRG